MFKLFNKLKRNKYRSMISYDLEIMEDFKYIYNSSKMFVVNTSGVKCPCCKRISKYIYEGPFYSEDEIEDSLCPECIKSGKAAKKFNGEFTPEECCEEISNQEIINEVVYRTPSYDTWQDPKWLACCDDLCQFVGKLTWSEVKELNIEQEIASAIKANQDFIDIGRPIEELIDAVESEDVDLCVFKCLHCNQYRIYIGLS